MLPSPHAAGVARRSSALVLLVGVILLTGLGAAVLPLPRVALAASATAASDAYLLAGPGEEFDILTVIPTAAPVSVDGDAVNGFVPVTYNGTAGWASTNYLLISSDEVAPPAPVDAAPVDAVPVDPAPADPAPVDSGLSGSATTTDTLNLRAGPSMDDVILLDMPPGAGVTLTGGAANGFLEVTYNGTTGWALGEYLSVGAEPAVAPLPDPLHTTDEVAPASESLSTDAAPGSRPGHGDSSGGGDITQIIYAAADRYDQPRDDMLRVATCESNLDPNAVNAGGGTYGLFQFLPDTFASTPYADGDIFDPYANANAAAWMWSQGRRNEWVCQ
jgi:uncharacterized protein YraI